LLGTSHLYKGYDGIPFDPEGLLSTIPSVVTVICGFLTGNLIDANPSRIVLVKRMLMWGVGALLVGWLLNFEFPINKPIWSSSYVIFMAGWCLVFNALLIWLIDVQGLKGWTKPIIVLGMNSLLAFVVSGVYVKTISKLKFDSSYEVITQKWDNQMMPKQIGGYQKLYETVFSPITTPYQMLKNVKDKTITKDNNPSVWADFTEKQKLSSFLFAVFHVFLFWLILWVFYKKGIFLKV
jgi:predicted acyltransferase